MDDIATLEKGYLNHSTQALAKLITACENEDDSIHPVLERGYSKVGRAKIVGITGPPGGGKSSLIDKLTAIIRERQKTVAIICIDPTSPFTGGAVLGDRIRLTSHFNDPGVFIRSLSTRGKLGGLSLATRQTAHLCDAFGFDFIMIETVGVGQSEVDVHYLADLVVAVLVPEWGDAIQVLKAGMIEIGDIFVVNKCDRQGWEILRTALTQMVQEKGEDEASVLATSIHDEKSISNLFQAIETQLGDTAKLYRRRRLFAQRTFHELTHRWFEKKLMPRWQPDDNQLVNPYSAFVQFRNRLEKHMDTEDAKP